MSESNTAVGRPLPLWPYSASDNVSRSLGSEPDKMAINLSMSFVDYPWRFVHVPQAEIAAAAVPEHGARRAAGVRGGRDDGPGRIGRDSSPAKPIFEWHAEHEDLYVGQQNAARVLLLATGDTAAYRGFFRLLTEQHIPFAVSENMQWLDDAVATFDLVIAPGRVAAGARTVTCATAGRFWSPARRRPPLPIGRSSAGGATQGYWRVHDHAILPSLKDTNLLFIDGEYVELAPLDGRC